MPLLIHLYFQVGGVQMHTREREIRWAEALVLDTMREKCPEKLEKEGVKELAIAKALNVPLSQVLEVLSTPIKIVHRTGLVEPLYTALSATCQRFN